MTEMKRGRMAKVQDRRGIVIYQLDSAEPILFAAKELSQYLQIMTGTAAKVLAVSEYHSKKPGIWLGLANSFGKEIPPKKRNSKDLFDDGVFIRCKSGHGIVSGANERSVLFAAYRFLEEVGCRWFRSGPLGESVPKIKSPLRKEIAVSERPSARHRCI
jgi:hypothetical protein